MRQTDVVLSSKLESCDENYDESPKFYMKKTRITPPTQPPTPLDDPGLQPMTYDLDNGEGKKKFNAYVTPDISSFYQEPPGSRKRRIPYHKGLAGKFLNLSATPLKLFWFANGNTPNLLIGIVEPFQAAGTGTFQGHEFYFTPLSEPNRRLVTFFVTSNHSLYVYDPFDPLTQKASHLGSSVIPEENNCAPPSITSLSKRHMKLYKDHKANLKFAKFYRQFTGRDWLSHYKRLPPHHFMWPAEHFGQIHRIESRETHFVIDPPNASLGPIRQFGSQRIIPDTEPRLLQAYRSSRQTQIFTLKVLSCAPRIFEIDNFLSIVEANHLLEITKHTTLSRSTTTGGGVKKDYGSNNGNEDGGVVDNTRTSSNTWIFREASPIVDTIYRRVADILRIDESLLRLRDEKEYYPHLMSSTSNSIAEALQVVHYDRGQEYTAHHDFGFPVLRVDDHELPSRFATMLLYLNEGMEGGQTSFPKFMNAETNDSLIITPKKGKAILFYSFLPDGNHDDLTLHAALPVQKGEKWISNFWVWDPFYPEKKHIVH